MVIIKYVLKFKRQFKRLCFSVPDVLQVWLVGLP